MHADTSPRADLSTLLITLLKGVIYRDEDEARFGALLALQPRVREYVAVLGLELIVDEAEGYAFLRSRPDDEPDAFGESDAAGESGVPADGDPAQALLRRPRLVARRPLSFPVSLLLALLRRKLVEFDAGGGESRLVLSREDIVELLRVFLPDSSNEARLIDQVDTHINKIVELGFLRRLKSAGPAAGAAAGHAPASFEVRRILKAFVDAQWLGTFEARLAAYRAQLLEARP